MSFASSTKKQPFLSQFAGVMESVKTGTAMAMLAVLALVVFASNSSRAETVIVSTLAGGEAGFADGQGGNARFYYPHGIAIDTAGNLYVADMKNNCIRKVTSKGEVSTFAGGESGFADGQGSAARLFLMPSKIAIDAAGDLYVTDMVGRRIRKVTQKGEVSTLTGSEYGVALDAPRFSDIAIDAAGDLYAVNEGNNRISKVTPAGEVNDFVGGRRGFADGQGSAAQFHVPTGIVIDAVGNLYVADTFNHRIRRVTPSGEVSTLAGSEEGFADGQGSAARFNEPSGIAIDADGNLYVVDRSNHSIRKVTPRGEVSTLAGDGKKGFADGQGSAARFNNPSSIAVDVTGNLYVADFNHRIRKIVIQRP